MQQTEQQFNISYLLQTKEYYMRRYLLEKLSTFGITEEKHPKRFERILNLHMEAKSKTEIEIAERETLTEIKNFLIEEGDS